MTPAIQDTLLQLFENVRQDPDTLPTVPVDRWQEGSGEWRLLSGFQDMLEQVQQRMLQFKEMEQQLREREEQYRSIFEASTDSLTIARSEDGQIVEVNPATCKMLGYTYEEMIGLTPADLVPPDNMPLVAEALQTIQAGGQPDIPLIFLLRKDGTSYPAEAHAAQFTYKGKPHLLAVTRDITERIQAEQQLREKEAQYRSIFEATSDGLFITDFEDGHLVEVNPMACRMHGYNYEEFITLHPTAFIHPDSHHLFAEYIQTVKAGGQFQARAVDVRKDGTTFPVEVYGTTFTYNGRPHVLGVVRDITKQVQAEQQLREKEEQYRSIFEASTDGLFIVDLEDSHVVEVNPMACQMWGYTHEEMLGRPIGIVDDTQQIPVHALEVIRAGGRFQMRDITTRKDGTSFNAEVHATPFTYKGKPHLLAIVRDISEQVQAEEQLREREEQYRSVFEATYDGMVILDQDGFYVEVNPAFCNMFGYTNEELAGLHASFLTLPEYLPVLDEALETFKAGGTFQAAKVQCPRKDGTVFYADAHSTTFTYRGKPHSLGVIRDITEQVQAQQLLEQRVEERTHELSSLLEISHTVASTLQLKPLLGLILDQLKMVVDYTGSSILAVEGEELVFLDSRGPTPGEQLMQLRFPLKNLRLIWKMITARESIIMQDMREDTPLARAFRVAMGHLGETTFHYVRACLFVPLTLREQVIGMLVLTSSEEQAFTQHHAALALAIANQAAIAIENARLYAQAQELAAVEERQRLARELHDSVSQALYGISLGVHTARLQLDRNPKELAESLDYVLELAEAALIEMRALIFELRPDSLETEGLVTALTKQAAALQARQGIIVQLNLSKEPDVALKVKQDLYRIAQEALHNTVKHARASQVELQLDQTGEVLMLLISDNGRGFDATSSFPGHLGLHSMQERVKSLGGELQIESAPGQGTRIRAQVPVREYA